MAENAQQLTVHWARLVFDLLKREGLNADALFEQSGLDILQLANPDAYFKQDCFTRLWSSASQQSGNPAIGLQMGVISSINAFDVYSSSIISSRCLREALARAVRYQKIVGSALTLLVEETREGCLITFNSRGDVLLPSREGYDAALALMATTLRLISNPPIVPLYVEFCYSEPPDVAPYRAAFNCELRFAGERFRLCVDKLVMDQPLVFANESVAAHHDEQLEEAIEALDDAPLPARVCHFIRQRLPVGGPSIQLVAEDLNMSPRTLQRHLHLERVSFRSLLDEIRKTLAGELISDPEVHLHEITYLLGFSDHSNFYRAFRRWYGCSPGLYRKTSLSN